MKLALVCHSFNQRPDAPLIWPLGFLYVSAVLKRAGHRVKFFNFNLRPHDLKAELKGMDAALFGGSSEFLPLLKEDAALCRKLGVKSILGGPLATFCADEMLEHFETVIMRAAEEVLEDALVSSGKIQGRKPNLRGLPYPDYDGFGVEEYFRRNGRRELAVLSSRGCPHSCIFCAEVCPFQMRPLADVFAEVDFSVKKYGLTHLWFFDGTLNLSKDRFLALCEGMRERPPWSGFIRVEPFDEEMAEAAKGSGVRYLGPGVESFRQEKLDMMKKGVTVKQICRTLDLLAKYRIEHVSQVLVGWPGESEREIIAELEGIPDRYRAYISPAVVQPFPGTRVAKERSVSGKFLQTMMELFALCQIVGADFFHPMIEKLKTVALEIGMKE